MSYWQERLLARTRRIERRLGRTLHWWESNRLKTLALEFDVLATKSSALGRGEKLTTFRLGPEPDAELALTWTVTEAA